MGTQFMTFCRWAPAGQNNMSVGPGQGNVMPGHDSLNITKQNSSPPSLPASQMSLHQTMGRSGHSGLMSHCLEIEIIVILTLTANISNAPV